MPWWGSSAELGGAEPKRKNRFLLKINSKNQYAVKSVTKPTVNIETKEFKMINHVYTYPGIAKWDPITVTFVDGDSNNTKVTDSLQTSKDFYNYLTKSGYVKPNSRSKTSKSSPSKSDMKSKVFGNSLQIQLLTPDGKTTIENWTLFNPIITKLSWGDLSYEDDSFIEYSMDIKYDWAELE